MNPPLQQQREAAGIILRDSQKKAARQLPGLAMQNQAGPHQGIHRHPGIRHRIMEEHQATAPVPARIRPARL